MRLAQIILNPLMNSQYENLFQGYLIATGGFFAAAPTMVPKSAVPNHILKFVSKTPISQVETPSICSVLLMQPSPKLREIRDKFSLIAVINLLNRVLYDYGDMSSKTTKKKHVTREAIESEHIPTNGQFIAKVIVARGNNLYEVVPEYGDGDENILVSMPYL